jgi:hypothetical protein
VIADFDCLIIYIGPLVLLLPKILIIWLSNLLILSVPDEGYSRNMSCTIATDKLYPIKLNRVQVARGII